MRMAGAAPIINGLVGALIGGDDSGAKDPFGSSDALSIRRVPKYRTMEYRPEEDVRYEIGPAPRSGALADYLL